MPKSNYLAAQIVQHEFGKATYTPPATWYLALCKTVPSPSDTGSTISEVTYTNYIRKSFVGTDLGAVVAETISNVNVITFAAPGNTGDTANGWAVCDAATLGNMLWFNTLNAVSIAANGAAPSLAVGALNFTES